MLRTELCDLLRIEVPIIGAPMGPSITGPELAAVVSNDACTVAESRRRCVSSSALIPRSRREQPGSIAVRVPIG